MAPAKVNLGLRVSGRRPDGYHEVQTLMVPISLYDRLSIRVARGEPVVRCSCRGVERAPAGPSNLASRAARAVLQCVGIAAEVDILLDKRIPVGAGLGGGSSDAAAVLRLLPDLLGVRLPKSRMLALAARLGADVPFFLEGRPALACGVGDLLVPIPRFPSLSLVIAIPPERVATAWAYAEALPLASKQPLAAAGLRPGGALGSLRATARLPWSADRINSSLSNDFEQGVGAVFQGVPRLLDTLRTLGAWGTVMSGSGSAVVGLFESAGAARNAAAAIGPPDKAFAVRVLQRVPAVLE